MQSVIDSLPFPILLVDPLSYAVRMANAAAGHVDEVRRGVTCHQLSHRSDLPCTGGSRVCPVNSVRLERQAVVVEHRHRDEAGAVRTVQVFASPLFDDSGALELVMECAVDVTDARHAEQQLSQFQMAIERSADAIFMTDREGVFSYINPAFEQLYGYSRLDVEARTPSILDSDVPGTEAHDDLWSARLRTETWAGVLLHRARDGRLVAVEQSLSPILDRRGDAAGFLAIQRDVTARKSEEEERARSAAWFRALFEKSGDHAFVLRLVEPGPPLIEEANEAACRSHGYLRDELIGKPISFLDPHTEALPVAEIVQSLRAGEAVRFETNHKRKDGSVFPVEVTGFLVASDSGDQRLVTTERDISDRKELERRELRSRYRVEGLLALFEHEAWSEAECLDLVVERIAQLTQSKLAVVGLLDEAGRCVSSHSCTCDAAATCGVRNVPLSLELEGDDIWVRAIRHGQHAIIDQLAPQRTLKPAVSACQTRIQRWLGIPLLRDGRVVMVAGVANKELAYDGRDRDEALLFLEGVWQHICRRRADDERARLVDELVASDAQLKEVVSALEASRRSFSGVVERSREGILILDLDGVVLYCNASAQQLLREPPEALLGTSLGVRLVDGAIAEVDITRRSGAPGVGELRLQPTTWMERPAYLAVVSDVSARKQDEQEREALRVGLAQSERLSTMGMLAAGVAHEINNPLSFVLYNLDSVVDDMAKLDGSSDGPGSLRHELPPEALERLRDALAGTRRIKEITRGLATFSRVEREELGPVDLHETIEHAITMAFHEIKYRARLVKDYSRVPAVLATDGKVAQVFLNLLINAAHAVEEGHLEGNEIRVRTWAEGEDVFAEVSDSGGGIAPEIRDKLFTPFFTTKTVGKGSGLGLSICKSIVTGFGGRICLTSDVGEGACFLVSLPRLPHDWANRGRQTPPQRATPGRIRGRILAVDDEEGVRAAMARMLSREHDVITASNGNEALALLANDRRFDVIFCDLMMPELSGMEMHARLAQEDPALAEQVVFITGGVFTPRASHYLAKVGNMRLEKPFDPQGFVRMTHELVIASRAKRGA